MVLVKNVSYCATETYHVGQHNHGRWHVVPWTEIQVISQCRGHLWFRPIIFWMSHTVSPKETLRKGLSQIYISAESQALQSRVLVSVLFNRCRMCALAGLDSAVVFFACVWAILGGERHCWAILLLEGGEAIFVVSQFLQELKVVWVVCLFIKPVRILLNPFCALW